MLGYPAPSLEPAELEDLVPLAFEEHAEGIDRLRARALALPPGVIDDVALREPIGSRHPLRIAEAVARLGGRPAGRARSTTTRTPCSPCSAPREGPARAHEDPDPARRVARRILQRLDGMGKWGGYHTEFAHLARGFAGNDRALAQEVGEALLEAGLLAEKPSVGQRHVYLNPRRAGEIRQADRDRRGPSGYEACVRKEILAIHMLLSRQQVSNKLHTLVTLTRAGIVQPERPDRLWHTARALLRCGARPPPATRPRPRAIPDEPR